MYAMSAAWSTQVGLVGVGVVVELLLVGAGVVVELLLVGGA